MLELTSPTKLPVIVPLNGPVPISAVKLLPGRIGYVAIARGPMALEAVGGPEAIGAPTKIRMFQIGVASEGGVGVLTGVAKLRLTLLKIDVVVVLTLVVDTVDVLLSGFVGAPPQATAPRAVIRAKGAKREMFTTSRFGIFCP